MKCTVSVNELCLHRHYEDIVDCSYLYIYSKVCDECALTVVPVQCDSLLSDSFKHSLFVIYMFQKSYQSCGPQITSKDQLTTQHHMQYWIYPGAHLMKGLEIARTVRMNHEG